MEHETQPGPLKRNAGWILAGLMAIGALPRAIVAGSTVELVASVGGLFAAVAAVGVVAQHFNSWTSS